ncbi:MAG: ABC transporter permease [Porcipelethomonas sp.]
MLIIINAFKSITRSLGRNILIAIIVITIAVSSSIALAIRSAADKAKESGLSSQTITGTISLNRENLMESAKGSSDKADMRGFMQGYSGLSLEEMMTYGDSDYVKEFYYTASLSLNAGEDLEPYSTEEEESTEEGSEEDTFEAMEGGMDKGMGKSPDMQQAGMEQGQKAGKRGMTMGDFSVTGYSSETAMTKFISGESQITDGSMFQTDADDFNCLISKELALFNDLAVGDTITLTNPDNEEDVYSLTVCGIYTNSSSDVQSGQMMFGTANDPANAICVSCLTISNIAEQSENSVVTDAETGTETSAALSPQISGSYLFASKADYDSFGEELVSKGLPEYYTLSSADVSSYESSIVPLENLSKFALTFLTVILLVGAIVLVVLNVFHIQQRKYEVGVLTAIGIRKIKVAAQFVIELLSVTLIAIIIGTGIGAAASVPVSNQLLSSQIEAQETVQDTQEQNFGRGGGRGDMLSMQNQTQTDYIDTVNASVDFHILLELIGIGVVLTVVSSLAGIVFIMRYDPLKILASRT